MPRTKLTQDEMTFLAAYERQMKTAVEARWCSNIPQNGIDGMLRLWENLTGTTRPFRVGCSNCILHLVMDLGQLYFKQKAESAEKPVTERKPRQVSKPTQKPGKPVTAKNSK